LFLLKTFVLAFASCPIPSRFKQS